MSISKKDFVSENFKKKTLPSEENNVDTFLKTNKERAYTVKEIAKATKKSEEGVRGRILILKQKKKVSHKIPYFMWK